MLVSHDDLCGEGLCGTFGAGRVVAETFATGEFLEDLSLCEERIGRVLAEVGLK